LEVNAPKSKCKTIMWSTFKSIILESLSEEHMQLKLDYKKKKGHWLFKPTIKLMKQRSMAGENINISNPQPIMRITAKLETKWMVWYERME